MRIEIWSDIVCPWCAIGMKRFHKALEAFPHRDGVEVVLRSFELDPDSPADLGMPLDRMLSRKYGMTVEEAHAANARVAGLAAAEGLSFRMENTRPGNSFAAHRLVHLAAESGKASAVHQAFMKGYFCDGLAVGDPAALVAAAVEAGLERADALHVLGSEAYAEEVRADESRAAQFGITGVPFFAIEETWGISGAQPLEVFQEALASCWAKVEAATA